MMEKYLLGIDLGTSAVKVCCFDAQFHLIAQAKGEYITRFDAPAYAEQDPEDWWRETVKAIRQVMSKIDGIGEVGVISVSSQSPSLIPLDRDGKVLHRAMIWMDRRASEESDYAAHTLIGYETYKKILRSEPDAYYVLPKILWYRKHEPHLYQKTRMYLQVNGFINYMLTGKYSIDLIHAVAVQGMDYEKQDWSEEISALVDIPFRDVFPKISKPYEIIGEVTQKAGMLTGLKPGIPVVAGATDTIAAFYGYGTIGENGVAEMSGTSSILLFNSGSKIKNYGNMLVKPSLFDSQKEILVAAISSSGASVEWFRKLFQNENGMKLSYEIMQSDAASVLPGSGKVIFFPYLAGERSPLFNSYARGMFIGMTNSTRREHMARAVLEGTSYALRHNFEEAEKLGIKPEYMVCGGGGAKNEEWLKIKAAVLGIPVKVLEDGSGDRAALGDAMIAAYGIGMISRMEEASDRISRYRKIIEPNPDWVMAYDQIYPFFRSIYQNLEENLKCLEKLEL